jgi:hypothetical protein
LLPVRNKILLLIQRKFKNKQFAVINKLYIYYTVFRLHKISTTILIL